MLQSIKWKNEVEIKLVSATLKIEQRFLLNLAVGQTYENDNCCSCYNLRAQSVLGRRYQTPHPTRLPTQNSLSTYTTLATQFLELN